MMGFLEHLIHHARGQLAGVRVLAARMVAANERLPIRDPMDDTMCERRLRTLMDAAMCQQPYVRVETDCPEADHHAHPPQRGRLVVEMRQAVGDLFGCRLVAGWRATYRRSDECVAELEAIAGMTRRREIRESGTMESRHQEVAGAADAITREHAAGPVRPVRGRREADEEQMRIRIPETRNRPGPIGFVRECAALLTPDLQAVRAEAYAAVAPDDRITRRFQRLP